MQQHSDVFSRYLLFGMVDLGKGGGAGMLLCDEEEETGISRTGEVLGGVISSVLLISKELCRFSLVGTVQG